MPIQQPGELTNFVDWQEVRRRKQKESGLNKKRHVKENHGLVKTRQQIQADYRVKKEGLLALPEVSFFFLHLFICFL